MTSVGSDKSVHAHSLARGVAAHLHKVWQYRQAQTKFRASRPQNLGPLDPLSWCMHISDKYQNLISWLIVLTFPLGVKLNSWDSHSRFKVVC